MIIRLVIEPVRDDFFTLSGADIPDDAVLEFTTAVGVVTVRPDFIRPTSPSSSACRPRSRTAPPSSA